MAYASLSLAIGAIYLWTYVYNLVRVFSGQSIDSGNNVVKETRTMQDDLTESLLPSTSSTLNRKVKVMLNTMKQQLGHFSRMVNLKTLFAPSTNGAIVGFVVGTISPMRKLLIGTTAHLRVIQDSASLVGDAAIPTMTLILGANLLRGWDGCGAGILILHI